MFQQSCFLCWVLIYFIILLFLFLLHSESFSEKQLELVFMFRFAFFVLFYYFFFSHFQTRCLKSRRCGPWQVRLSRGATWVWRFYWGWTRPRSRVWNTNTLETRPGSSLRSWWRSSGRRGGGGGRRRINWSRPWSRSIGRTSQTSTSNKQLMNIHFVLVYNIH